MNAQISEATAAIKNKLELLFTHTILLQHGAQIIELSVVEIDAHVQRFPCSVLSVDMFFLLPLWSGYCCGRRNASRLLNVGAYGRFSASTVLDIRVLQHDPVFP